MQPSKVPGRNGIPWPMSPSRRSPSTSLSSATSVTGKCHNSINVPAIYQHLTATLKTQNENPKITSELKSKNTTVIFFFLLYHFYGDLQVLWLIIRLYVWNLETTKQINKHSSDEDGRRHFLAGITFLLFQSVHIGFLLNLNIEILLITFKALSGKPT